MAVDLIFIKRQAPNHALGKAEWLGFTFSILNKKNQLFFRPIQIESISR